MSLKVPRGFVTISEDAIAQQYAGMRRKHAHQDRVAARQKQDAQNLSIVAKGAIAATALIGVAAFAKPVLNLVMACL